MDILHSVRLDAEKCVGCTDCIKRCPTEAIRVRNSKAEIMGERCIDCGMCIRICRNSAKQAVTNSIEDIFKYKYKVAIPAPTLYTQFKRLRDPNIILTGLKYIGFDEVFEVAKAAEIISEYTRNTIDTIDVQKPIISSACPAIVRLIQIRFPTLIPNILPIISPKEAASRYVKDYLVKKGMKEEDIGVFFISPCAAKVTSSRVAQVYEKSCVDGVISLKDIYLKLVPVIKNLGEPEILQISKSEGIGWAAPGGEGRNTNINNHIAIDGIENVIKILERVEDGKLNVDFIECLACVNGCLGGPLTVEDSFVAAYRMEKIKTFVEEKGKFRDLDIYKNPFKKGVNLDWDSPLLPKQVLMLDEDMFKALEKMEKLEDIYSTLPQIDCGSCGAPTCRALAEDIVCGKANIEDCIFMLREKVRSMAAEMVTLAEKIPPSLSDKQLNKKENQ